MFGESNLFWFSLFCSPVVKVLTRPFCLVFLRLSLQSSVCLYWTLSLPERLMEFCKVTFESADEILWSVTIQMKALCPYLHMILFVFQNFTKWNLGICFRLNLAVAPCLLPKISGGITITIIVITVTTSLSLSQPWSFFSSPPLKSLSFHHLCSPYRYETGGWPAWGYANSRRISGRRFSPSENSVCEPERQNDFRDVKPF